MAEEKKVRHLSIYLIKAGYETDIEILNTELCETPVEVAISGFGAGRLHIKKTSPHPPPWADFFKEFVDPKLLSVRGVAAAFLIKIDDRYFALAFGQAGRFLLKDDVFEERFGLLCALNAVNQSSLRCVDVQSLDAIDSHTRIQSGQETTADQFGLSVEQDMLKAIVGAPSNTALGTRMTGSDALSVSVALDLADLPHLLRQYRQLFDTDLDGKNYQWVNNIATTKSTSLIAELEAKLDAKLVAKEFESIWLAIPEIIEWTMVRGFVYTHGKGTVHPDINFHGFLKTVNEPLTLELMRQRKVYCADAELRPAFKHWSVYKCMYAEVDHNDAKFVLNDGKWFTVAKDFLKRIKAEYDAIPASKLKLPEYTGGGEGAYNLAVAAAAPSIYDCLDDTKKVMHGGGQGQIEICDLFTSTGELIHVKMYGKSSVLSHLFSQGFVSGQLIQIDSDFRQKVRARLSETHRELIQVSTKPTHQALTITYAVISEEPGSTLHLPFFSRVNLVNIRKVLLGFGYKVELLKIPVDPTFSKTILQPSKKSKKNK
jgi:uncharacterized protein (TIGR04141 family)